MLLVLFNPLVGLYQVSDHMFHSNVLNRCWGGYPSAEVQSVYFKAPADRAIIAFMTNILMSYKYKRRCNFSSSFVNLCIPVNFLTIWMGGIIDITNRRGGMDSPKKKTLGIFSSARICSFVANSTFFWTFDMDFMNLIEYIYICGTIS